MTNLSEAYQYSKWSKEEVREAAMMKFGINKAFCEYFKADSTTLYVQVVDEKLWKKTIIHLIPRFKADLPDNDQIYKMLDKYPARLLTANAESEGESSNL